MPTVTRETYRAGVLVSSDTVTLPDEVANAQTLQDQARTALAGNKTFLGLNNPTAAENAAQIKALTRQSSGLIRLFLGALDRTE